MWQVAVHRHNAHKASFIEHTSIWDDSTAAREAGNCSAVTHSLHNIINQPGSQYRHDMHCYIMSVNSHFTKLNKTSLSKGV